MKVIFHLVNSRKLICMCSTFDFVTAFVKMEPLRVEDVIFSMWDIGIEALDTFLIIFCVNFIILVSGLINDSSSSTFNN